MTIISFRLILLIWITLTMAGMNELANSHAMAADMLDVWI